MRMAEKMMPVGEAQDEATSNFSAARNMVDAVWKHIAPTWPLRSLIAVNPLAGFENLPFEEGLRQGQAYFGQKDLPTGMKDVNRQTIKWLQAFFDQGQATIKMPLRDLGLLNAVFSLLAFDRAVKGQSAKTWQWIEKIPADTEKIIPECLLFLGIPEEDRERFLTLMLSTLPGWAAYIKYRTDWPDLSDQVNPHTVSKHDYLALRLVLTCLIWPEAKTLLNWHKNALAGADVKNILKSLSAAENEYREQLLKRLSLAKKSKPERAAAQLVFCIDVRSEPFRRALEKEGNYETFGFAGFFGVPVSIENSLTGETHASCPVLLKPAFRVLEATCCDHEKHKKLIKKISVFKKLYQCLKYTFATPFTLVEALGPFSGALMGWKNISPDSYVRFKNKTSVTANMSPLLEAIPFENQVSIAAGALKTMGLTENFSPLVVLCGHGSETQNNAYATALDCGACGGHHGAPNARILAAILKNSAVVTRLAQMDIRIPGDTYFIAAEHNTTTDEVIFYDADMPTMAEKHLSVLRNDLEKARVQNSLWRASQLGESLEPSKAVKHVQRRAADWAQIRAEWGLARNAAFIVGPRALTKDIDLEGRSFLHSYDWKKDIAGTALTLILTAPMVVAQWINAQYLFSTLDNVAYGGGSKISKNITGKIGIMQGNASDLMHGLPLQSIHKDDQSPYHQPMRLMTVVYAPRKMIDAVIVKQETLQRLFGNGWVALACVEPETGEKLMLGRDLKWQTQP